MNTQTKAPSTFAWVLLILLSMVWGSSFILIKKGLLVFSPGEVGALRIFVAFLVLIPFSIRAISKIPQKKLPLLFSVGFMGSFIPALLFAVAQTRLESAIAGIVNSITPIFVILIGFIFFKKKISYQSTLGVFLGFLGCVFVMLGGANFNISGINYYAFFIMAATVLYAINVNIIKHFLPDIKALHITAVSFLLVSPFCIAYLFLATEFLAKVSFETDFLMALTFISILGAIGTALAMFMFNHLIKITSPVFASSCTYIIPIVSIGWGILDNEVLNIYQYLGIGIVLGGVYLANRK